MDRRRRLPLIGALLTAASRQRRRPIQRVAYDESAPIGVVIRTWFAALEVLWRWCFLARPRPR